MALDLDKDIKAFSKLAKTIPSHKDKKCDPLPIWPDVVLNYCDQLAERLGFGDEELVFCKCYNIDSKTLTRRKPILKIKGNADENYEKVDFSKGMAPKEEFPDLPKRAMMDLGATFKAKSKWDDNWNKPRLDSRTGIHSAGNQQNEGQWWEVDMPGSEFYKVSQMTLMKRADGFDTRGRLITAVQF